MTTRDYDNQDSNPGAIKAIMLMRNNQNRRYKNNEPKASTTWLGEREAIAPEHSVSGGPL